MNQDREEQQRRHRELFDAGAVENRLDHLWAAQNIVGVPRSAVELVAQALAGDSSARASTTRSPSWRFKRWRVIGVTS